MNKQDNPDTLNVHPFHSNRKTVFHSGHLKRTVLQPAVETWHLNYSMLEFKVTILL